MVKITNSLTIPDEELDFTATRASGPGGQHVNKTSTSVTLRFDVAGSPSLSDHQRARLLTKLDNRITKDGVLTITAQDTRSQLSNKELAVSRFAELLAEALKPAKRRKKTRPTLASKQRRLNTKKKRADIKKKRGKVTPHD